MRVADETELLHALPSGTLRIGADVWRLYLVDTRRIGRDWFIHLVVVGSRTHAVDVRARADCSHSTIAQRVVMAVSEWLVSGDLSDHAFLELPGFVEQAC